MPKLPTSPKSPPHDLQHAFFRFSFKNLRGTKPYASVRTYLGPCRQMQTRSVGLPGRSRCASPGRKTGRADAVRRRSRCARNPSLRWWAARGGPGELHSKRGAGQVLLSHALPCQAQPLLPSALRPEAPMACSLPPSLSLLRGLPMSQASQPWPPVQLLQLSKHESRGRLFPCENSPCLSAVRDRSPA